MAGKYLRALGVVLLTVLFCVPMVCIALGVVEVALWLGWSDAWAGVAAGISITLVVAGIIALTEDV
jgi:hypothetical protein